VNYEGRAQISYQVNRCHSQAQPAWRWLTENQDAHVDSFVNRCASEVEEFAGLQSVLPDVSQLIAGMKIPRQSHRYSGRTAMKANLNVSEPKQPVDNESPMSFSMEGIPSQKDASILGAAWAPQWNSNQAISKFQDEINGELKQSHVGTHLLSKHSASGYFFPLDLLARPASNDGLQLAIAVQIFGSDELSARSPAIRERMTGPYLSLSPADAKARGLQQCDQVSIGDTTGTATVCIRNKMQDGTAALYCGDNEIDQHSLPAQIEVQKLETEAGKGIDGLIVSELYEEGY